MAGCKFFTRFQYSAIVRNASGRSGRDTRTHPQRSDFLLVVSDEDIYRSREFQVPIQPRARVETVQERPESWGKFVRTPGSRRAKSRPAVPAAGRAFILRLIGSLFFIKKERPRALGPPRDWGGDWALITIAAEGLREACAHSNRLRGLLVPGRRPDVRASRGARRRLLLGFTSQGGGDRFPVEFL